MIRFAVLCAFGLAGCVTAGDLAQQVPAATYTSAKARAVVADCLLDRVISPDLHPSRTEAPGETVLTFTSAGAMIKPQPAIYLFTIRDTGAGSTIDVRRSGHADLLAAETCF